MGHFIFFRQIVDIPIYHLEWYCSLAVKLFYRFLMGPENGVPDIGQLEGGEVCAYATCALNCAAAIRTSFPDVCHKTVARCMLYFAIWQYIGESTTRLCVLETIIDFFPFSSF